MGLHFAICEVDPFVTDLLLLLLLSLLLNYVHVCASVFLYVHLSVGATESGQGHQIP